MTDFEKYLSIIMIMKLLCKLAELSKRNAEKKLLETMGDFVKQRREENATND